MSIQKTPFVLFDILLHPFYNIIKNFNLKGETLKKLLIFITFTIILSGCMFSRATIRRDEKISRYFTMGEAVHSDTARRYGIDNTPSKQHAANIRYTAARLDQLRRILGRPVIVSSWYRNSKVNKKVGGSSTSAHTTGLAVDIILKKGAQYQEFQKVVKSSMKYDQLIYYPKRGHLHIGFRKNMKKERQQILRR